MPADCRDIAFRKSPLNSNIWDLALLFRQFLDPCLQTEVRMVTVKISQSLGLFFFQAQKRLKQYFKSYTNWERFQEEACVRRGSQQPGPPQRVPAARHRKLRGRALRSSPVPLRSGCDSIQSSSKFCGSHHFSKSDFSPSIIWKDWYRHSCPWSYRDTCASRSSYCTGQSKLLWHWTSLLQSIVIMRLQWGFSFPLPSFRLLGLFVLQTTNNTQPRN